MIAKETFTNKQASEYLSISPRQLFNLRKQGYLRGYQIGSRWYFTKEELDELIKSRQEDGHRV